MVRSEREDEVYPTAEQRAEERLLDLLLPPLPQAPPPPVGGGSQGSGGSEQGASRPLFVVSSKGDVESKLPEAETEANERRRRTREKLRAQLKDGQLGGPDVARDGVQRDLLPIVEGSTVQTRYGYVRTDPILFIAAGAFHIAKPSDLIPELQGRFPIRVELTSLTEADFVRIMTEPENALTKQYAALCQADGATLEFTPDGVKEIARIAAKVNERMENIGARRLHTVLTTLLEEGLFELPDYPIKHVVFDGPAVRERLLRIVEDEDLRKYIL